MRSYLTEKEGSPKKADSDLSSTVRNHEHHHYKIKPIHFYDAVPNPINDQSIVNNLIFVETEDYESQKRHQTNHQEDEHSYPFASHENSKPLQPYDVNIYVKRPKKTNFYDRYSMHESRDDSINNQNRNNQGGFDETTSDSFPQSTTRVSTTTTRASTTTTAASTTTTTVSTTTKKPVANTSLDDSQVAIVGSSRNIKNRNYQRNYNRVPYQNRQQNTYQNRQQIIYQNSQQNRYAYNNQYTPTFG
jgi:hypothetical protein